MYEFTVKAGNSKLITKHGRLFLDTNLTNVSVLHGSTNYHAFVWEHSEASAKNKSIVSDLNVQTNTFFFNISLLNRFEIVRISIELRTPAPASFYFYVYMMGELCQ